MAKADEKPAIMVVRRADFLTPAAPIDGDLIRDYPAAKPLRITLVQPRRSNDQNRLYWTLLKLVCENLDGGTTATALHAWLKLELGVVEPVKLRSGKIVYVPGSTAFDRMEHADFCKYFDAVINLVILHFLPGVNKVQLTHEVYAMLSLGPPDNRFYEET